MTERSFFVTYQLRWSIGKPALNAVHEFGDSQVETLGEDVERIQTGLLRSGVPEREEMQYPTRNALTNR